MGLLGNLAEGFKKKVNPFAVAKDLGKTLVGHGGPVLSYALAPSLGPLAGVASSVITGALNFGLQWGLQRLEKWQDRREVNRAEVQVKKSIAEFINTQKPKVEKEKRGKMAEWLRNSSSKATVNIKELADKVEKGEIETPKLHPELPKDPESKKQIKKIQDNLEQWVSID